MNNLDNTRVNVPKTQMDPTTLTSLELQMNHTTLIIGEVPKCRICDFDEEEHNEDILVDLGCNCKGHMSKMHKKCILKWFGVRMLLQKFYTCEVCKSALNLEAQLVVVQGVSNYNNGERVILMQALKSSMALRTPKIDVERATTYKELVQLLLVEEGEQSQHQFAEHINSTLSNRFVWISGIASVLIFLTFVLWYIFWNHGSN